MKPRLYFLIAVLAAGSVLWSVGPAQSAQGPVLLGRFQDWDAYQMNGSVESTCYAVAKPVKIDRPPGLKREAGSFLVTIRTERSNVLEPSYISGYVFQRGTPVKLLVGDRRINMFTEDDGAWVKTAAEERRLVDAMRGATTLIVQGTAMRGSPVLDHYSLRGFSQALTSIVQACR